MLGWTRTETVLVSKKGGSEGFGLKSFGSERFGFERFGFEKFGFEKVLVSKNVVGIPGFGSNPKSSSGAAPPFPSGDVPSVGRSHKGVIGAPHQVRESQRQQRFAGPLISGDVGVNVTGKPYSSTTARAHWNRVLRLR
jgi:hypothetical protein